MAVYHLKAFFQQLPDKSIASLVKYYYSWKKTRARTSLMDAVSEGRNPTSSGTGKRESGAGSDPGGSDKESDNDEKVCKMYHVLKCKYILPFVLICVQFIV